MISGQGDEILILVKVRLGNSLYKIGKETCGHTIAILPVECSQQTSKNLRGKGVA